MSFYPINPDTAIESFLLLDQEVQNVNLGQVYNLSELVPLNYRQIMNKVIIGSITAVPLREFCYVYQDAIKPNEINDEFSNLLQSNSLGTAFAQLFNYYKDALCNGTYNVAAGIITEIKTDLLPFNQQSLINGPSFCIEHKLKIEWFVVPGSKFS